MTDPTNQDPNQDPDKDQTQHDVTDEDQAAEDDWAAALAEQAGAESSQAEPAADDDWASAMAEQQAATPSQPPSQADGLGGDDWASALAEQSTTGSTPAQPAASAASNVFLPLSSVDQDNESDIDLIMDIPVQLSVELGRTRLTIKNILQLGQGSVVELDGLAGEPMDIFVNGYLIAQGEVVVVDDKYGIRLTDIITPSDRLSRLNGKR